MLQLLGVTEDSQVLEIGTGTGYNAALLSHRLGADNVASMDVDPKLVAAAGKRLSGLGYHPGSVLGTASPFSLGYGSTGSSPRVPSAVFQPLGLRNLPGVAASSPRCAVRSPAALSCFRRPRRRCSRPFPRSAGSFHGTARHREQSISRCQHPWKSSLTTRRRDTTLDPALLDDPDFRFFLQIHRPDLRSAWTTTTNRDRKESCLWARPAVPGVR